MGTLSKSLDHWKLGDIALARICNQVYAKVQVVKDEKGLFYDDKVLAISPNADGSITVIEELCYYVEILRRHQRLWLPYTSLHLAARSRPFYGVDKISPPKPIKPPTPRKRKIIEDHILPMPVKISKYKEPDLNTTYDIRHTPLKQGKHENAFKEFIRRGKEMIFDHYYYTLKLDNITNADSLEYIENIDASTEDKFEMAIKTFVTEKEIENYLHQCWKYNFVHKQTDGREIKDVTNKLGPPKTVVTIHTTWCLVCGKADKLRCCPNCPSSFHLACRREWLVNLMHRKKKQSQQPKKTVTLVEKILSSTRTITVHHTEKENMELCPSCMWGPRVGYNDVVWHKLGTCPWWPARVLTPGSVPSCLLSRSHTPHQWPLKYYGTLNYSWGDSVRMCLFLPSHVDCPRDEQVHQAALDACDDYIAVYLT